MCVSVIQVHQDGAQGPGRARQVLYGSPKNALNLSRNPVSLPALDTRSAQRHLELPCFVLFEGEVLL